jgi:hypothetical protein
MLWNMLGSGMPSQKSKTRTTRISSPVKKKQKGKKEAIFGIKKKKKNTQPVSQRAHYYLLCFVRCPSLLALFEKQNMEKMREEVISSGGTMDPTPAARYALSLLSIFFDCFWSCFLLLIKN